jgi:hypothetical protein
MTCWRNAEVFGDMVAGHSPMGADVSIGTERELLLEVEPLKGRDEVTQVLAYIAQ